LESETSYRILGSFGPFLRVLACPITGRQHQIRVHLSAIGLPIVGDKLYMSPEKNHFNQFVLSGMNEHLLNELILDRQALHAARITFPHPVTHEVIHVEAPMPMDMRNLQNF
jgi:23S rRNA pseudouridine1911/1915/1917 synthase